MKTELFDYDLPEDRIAVRPPKERDGGRMMVLGESEPRHAFVRDFAEELGRDDLLVLNRTKVRRARLFCRRPKTADGGGGRVELLFLHPLGDDRWAALGRASGPLRPGDVLEFEELRLGILGKDEEGVLSVEVQGDLESALERSGKMPIPPYFRREADDADVERYQTVFARDLGSAAAPTAGLHLTETTFEKLRARGTTVATLVLHVGIGTFRPVSADDLDRHPMHREHYEIGEELVSAIEKTRARGGRVVAVGTTVVRALESAAAKGEGISAGNFSTNLLIQPGFEFRVVDALLTNFHQPKSTLVSLVSAFAGRERILAAYGIAVRDGYRFLSYGDAMWIPRRFS